MTVRIITGDCREVLKTLPDASVQCCVTSPPYFGLRDYGVNGQIGLEASPEAYVAEMVDVFREVRRVLRDDGTLWLNLGDSYANDGKWGGSSGGKHVTALHGSTGVGRGKVTTGLKPKDLIGIPWAVATALRAPYYVGRLKSEADRAWLAGFLDGEGTISFVERDRGENTPTHDVRVFITNCDDGPLRHFAGLTAGNVYQHDGERENRFGSRPCFRWQMGTHDGALLLRELYPYLRTKRKQAALVWTLYTTLRHQGGHARTPAALVEKRRAIADMVRALNRGEPVDMPDWIEEPPSATEPGWYLRQDLIWAKSNPMPESVTDRCTKAHEYVFLLSKSERYYFDSEAMQEPANGQSEHDLTGGQYAPEGQRAHTGSRRAYSFARRTATTPPPGSPAQHRDDRDDIAYVGTRNKRSVWTVPTQPFRDAHFATFPPALIEPCILAGSRPGDTILDPFAGAGTTGLVADRLQRDAILVELNPQYAEMARKRIHGDAPLFAEVQQCES